MTRMNFAKAIAIPISVEIVISILIVAFTLTGPVNLVMNLLSVLNCVWAGYLIFRINKNRALAFVVGPVLLLIGHVLIVGSATFFETIQYSDVRGYFYAAGVIKTFLIFAPFYALFGYAGSLIDFGSLKGTAKGTDLSGQE